MINNTIRDNWPRPGTPERLALVTCSTLTALSAAGLWLLRRPTSWLSKLVDRAIDDAVRLPAARR